MALIGGGGAGNVAGGNPSGTGTSLNYIGNHCWAYSGEAQADNAPGTTFLEFDTGNSYLLVNVNCYNTVDDSTKINFEFTLNSEIIFQYTQEGRAASIGIHMGQGNEILLPPYSKFKVTGITPGSVTNAAVTLSGRVYA